MELGEVVDYVLYEIGRLRIVRKVDSKEEEVRSVTRIDHDRLCEPCGQEDIANLSPLGESGIMFPVRRWNAADPAGTNWIEVERIHPRRRILVSLVVSFLT